MDGDLLTELIEAVRTCAADPVPGDDWSSEAESAVRDALARVGAALSVLAEHWDACVEGADLCPDGIEGRVRAALEAVTEDDWRLLGREG